MVILPVVTWLFRVTCHDLCNGDTLMWVSHAVSGKPSMAIAAAWSGSSGTELTDEMPTYCAVDWASAGAAGKMSRATLGLGSDAARVTPALSDTTFHRNDCLRLVSVSTSVAPPCNALDRARGSPSRVP